MITSRFSPTCVFVISCMTLLAAPLCLAQPTGLNGAVVEAHHLFPASFSAGLVSFDWDASGTLHYSVGDPNWGLKLEVYKTATPDAIPVYQSSQVWAGSRLTRIGDYVYFNDGGDYMRSAFNYLFYPAVAADSVTPLLEYPYGASLWGLSTRNAGEFFASGTEMDWGPAVLFYNTLDASGGFAGLLTKFADLGDSPGPLAFDGDGNLYYAPGYAFSGTATIYRWSAAEVAAALANPATAALTPEGSAWATLPEPYDGATGMAADGAGNIYITATAWDMPSRLLAYKAANAAMVAVAEYSGRLETVRYRDNVIHFSCSDGVFSLPLPQVLIATDDVVIRAQPGETAIFGVEVLGGTGAIQYQWYRVSGDKADTPVGGNQPTYSMKATLADSGAQVYCVVTDATTSVASPYFTLVVQAPVPVATGAMRYLAMLLLITFGVLYLAKRARLS